MISQGLQNGDVPGSQDTNNQMTETQHHCPSTKADLLTEGVIPVIPEDLQNGNIQGLQDGDIQMTEIIQPYHHHPSRKADMSTGVTPVIPQGLQNGDGPGL